VRITDQADQVNDTEINRSNDPVRRADRFILVIFKKDAQLRTHTQLIILQTSSHIINLLSSKCPLPVLVALLAPALFSSLYLSDHRFTHTHIHCRTVNGGESECVKGRRGRECFQMLTRRRWLSWPDGLQFQLLLLFLLTTFSQDLPASALYAILNRSLHTQPNEVPSRSMHTLFVCVCMSLLGCPICVYCVYCVVQERERGRTLTLTLTRSKRKELNFLINLLTQSLSPTSSFPHTHT